MAVSPAPSQDSEWASRKELELPLGYCEDHIFMGVCFTWGAFHEGKSVKERKKKVIIFFNILYVHNLYLARKLNEQKSVIENEC